MSRKHPRFAAALAGVALLGTIVGASTRPADAQTTEQVPLATGCTSVVLTWPSGVLIRDVVAAITPADSVKAIWLRVPGTDTYLSYAPDAPQLVGGLRTAGYLETVQICMRTPGVLTRPLG